MKVDNESLLKMLVIADQMFDLLDETQDHLVVYLPPTQMFEAIKSINALPEDVSDRFLVMANSVYDDSLEPHENRSYDMHDLEHDEDGDDFDPEDYEMTELWIKRRRGA